MSEQKTIVPYLPHAAAMELRAEAIQALNDPLDPRVPEHERDLVVRAHEVLSLIEQAWQPKLGLATTKELRDELAARGPDGPDDYRSCDLPRSEPTREAAAS